MLFFWSWFMAKHLLLNFRCQISYVICHMFHMSNVKQMFHMSNFRCQISDVSHVKFQMSQSSVKCPMFAEICSDLRPRLNQRCVGLRLVAVSLKESGWWEEKFPHGVDMTMAFGYLKNDLTIDLKLRWIEPEPC